MGAGPGQVRGEVRTHRSIFAFQTGSGCTMSTAGPHTHLQEFHKPRQKAFLDQLTLGPTSQAQLLQRHKALVQKHTVAGVAGRDCISSSAGCGTGRGLGRRLRQGALGCKGGQALAIRRRDGGSCKGVTPIASSDNFIIRRRGGIYRRRSSRTDSRRRGGAGSSRCQSICPTA